MEILEKSVVFDATAQPDSKRIAFFSSLCPLASGQILAGFQLGNAKHSPTSTIGLCKSRDGGKTWQEIPVKFNGEFQGIPGSLAGGELVEVSLGKILLASTWFDRSDPKRPLFDPVTEGILKSKQLFAWSQDEGETWSPFHEIPTPGLKGCAMTGPLVRWQSGTIAFAFESFKEFDDPAPGYHGSWVLISKDGGRTFSTRRRVAEDPKHDVYYWDQRICATHQDGEYIALFWTHDLRKKQDLTVHLRRGRIDDSDAPQAAKIIDTGIPGQIAAPCLLPSGELLAFVVDRGDAGTMTLWKSPDGGKTWPDTAKLVIHRHQEQLRFSDYKQSVDFKDYWEEMGKWSFGHPAIKELHDCVLVAYYAGTPERMSLHCARVRF